jgi:hypothetical protein
MTRCPLAGEIEFEHTNKLSVVPGWGEEEEVLLSIAESADAAGSSRGILQLPGNWRTLGQARECRRLAFSSRRGPNFML